MAYPPITTNMNEVTRTHRSGIMKSRPEKR